MFSTRHSDTRYIKTNMVVIVTRDVIGLRRNVMARHPEVYQDAQWGPARQECMRRSNGLCERCKKKDKIKPGKIVHHRTWLTDTNKHDWNVAFNPDNLEYLCNQCHEDEHDRTAGLSKFVEPV